MMAAEVACGSRAQVTALAHVDGLFPLGGRLQTSSRGAAMAAKKALRRRGTESITATHIPTVSQMQKTTLLNPYS